MNATKPVTACAHCGTLSEGARFCCHGCEMAFEVIAGAGLEQYYAERTSPAPRPGPPSRGWETVPVVELDAHRREATMGIDSLRCAACAWVIEHVVERIEGVEEANVGLTSSRATVRWDSRFTDLPGIVRAVERLGYTPRPAGTHGQPDHDLLVRAGVAAFIAMNVMLASTSLYAGWFSGMDGRESALFRWFVLALSTPAALWAAAPIHARAWTGLRHGVLHMDLPVSIGVLAMWAHGVGATAAGSDTWLDSLAMLVALLLAGRVLEQRGRRQATEAADALAGSTPAAARRLRDGQIEEVLTGSLAQGDVVELAAGEAVPADGVVVVGRGSLHTALLTGESEPVVVEQGSRVHAGAVCMTGAFRVRVQEAGERTLLARIAHEMATAPDRPAPPTLTDRIAPWFTAATLVFAALGTAAWWGSGRAGEIGMAVLVVACPCALALATPLATAAGLAASGKRGFVLRSGEPLRALDGITLVAFDKTGTLTLGTPVVVSADDDVLRVAAGLERSSSHPIARAVVAEARMRGIALPEATEIEEIIGIGIRGVVDGQHWQLRGGQPNSIVLDGPQTGVIWLRDELRPEAPEVVAAIKQTGRKVALLSGDRDEVARRLGDLVGVSTAIGGVQPAGKSAWIAEQQAKGERVLFVGDGVNDGAALAAADVGVVMASGAASSVLVADAILVRDGLSPILAGFRASRAAHRAIRGNAVRSVGYNLGAVAFALAGSVNPLVAAVLMPLSSGLVVWGAARVEKETG